MEARGFGRLRRVQAVSEGFSRIHWGSGRFKLFQGVQGESGRFSGFLGVSGVFRGVHSGRRKFLIEKR